MADPGFADTEADEPSILLQPCNVYDVLLGQFLPGKETVHNMQSSVFSRPLYDLL